jgi:hypothetical protein
MTCKEYQRCQVPRPVQFTRENIRSLHQGEVKLLAREKNRSSSAVKDVAKVKGKLAQAGERSVMRLTVKRNRKLSDEGQSYSAKTEKNRGIERERETKRLIVGSNAINRILQGIKARINDSLKQRHCQSLVE